LERICVILPEEGEKPMEQILSTKMDAKVLRALEVFCQRHHLVKSRLLEELIKEGIRRRAETLRLAESLSRGLEDEGQGNLYTQAEVETLVFGKGKAR